MNNSGNVAIGNFNPTSTLSVVDTFAVNASTSMDRKFLVDTNGNVGVRTLASATSNSLCYSTSAITGLNVLSTCSSSIRYKEDVTDLSVDYDKVMSLRPVSFKWKGSGESDQGLIAEEVNQIFPELTFQKDGQIEGVRYQELGVYTLAALQELNAKFIQFAANNGQFTTDEQGFVVIEKLKTEELKIASNKTIGYGRIKQGETLVSINAPAIKSTSNVFLSFMDDVAGRTWYVVSKNEGSNFTIGLSGAAPYDLHFSWWIVDSDQSYDEYLQSLVPAAAPEVQTPIADPDSSEDTSTTTPIVEDASESPETEPVMTTASAN